MIDALTTYFVNSYMKLYAIIGVLVLILLVGITVMIGSCHESSEESTPTIDTVYVDKPITIRDTINVDVPYRVNVYQQVTKTRIDTIRVPVHMNPVGVVGANPVIRESPSRLSLVSYSLPEQRWSKRYYQLQPSPWRFSVDVYGVLWQPVFKAEEPYFSGYRAGAGVRIKYRCCTIYPFVEINHPDDLTYGVRLSYNIFEL